jgi:hypothetical protein
VDKIKQLLQKCGMSDEASAQICEALDNHANELKSQSETEFQQRLAKAKKVCFEEVETHKAELSRRVQIFLEAKNVAIDELITRQMANRETEAVAKLEKIYALLEGIELNGGSNSELNAELAKFKKLAGRLVEERNKATQKAQRCVSISERVLRRNRQLEKVVTEGVGQPTATEKPKRLDGSRSNGSRQTTQRTLKENVERAPATTPQAISVATMTAPRSPQEIAAFVEETV